MQFSSSFGILEEFNRRIRLSVAALTCFHMIGADLNVTVRILASSYTSLDTVCVLIWKSYFLKKFTQTFFSSDFKRQSLRDLKKSRNYLKSEFSKSVICLLRV